MNVSILKKSISTKLMKYKENEKKLKKIIDEIIINPHKFFKYGKKSKKFINLRIKILRLASKELCIFLFFLMATSRLQTCGN